MSKTPEASKASQGAEATPSAFDSGFGAAFTGASSDAAPPTGARGGQKQQRGGPAEPVGLPTVQRGNFGVSRSSKRHRVAGQKPASVTGSGRLGEPTYTVAGSVQFNDTDEMVLSSISLSFCYDIVTELFTEKWGLDSSNQADMRKAEDVLCALFVTRTASPYADYDFLVMIGGKEVNCSDFASLLADYEVSRRQFSRGWADKTSAYIKEESNTRLRGHLVSSLGINSQFVHLGFDGSGGCTGMNRNEVAFVKSLESTKLFDDSAVHGSLGSGNLLDGQFDSKSTRRRELVV